MSVSTQASSEKTGSACADAQALQKSARQAYKLGASNVGPSAPTKRHPLTHGTGLKTSPKSQAPTVSVRSGPMARCSACPSEKLLVEGVWVDVGGIFKTGPPTPLLWQI